MGTPLSRSVRVVHISITLPVMHVRPAREGDLDRLVSIHMSAFPDPRGVEARVRNFTKNPLGTPDDLRVAEDGGAIVGHAFLFRMRAWFGGARVRCGGIATVGVAPEARGRGVAGALLEALHAEADARGDALTILHAFRQGFYARHGYAPVSPHKVLRFSPRAVPREWGRDASGGVVRRATGDDRKAIEAVHARMGKSRTGWLERPQALWDRRILNERRVWLVVERRGKVVGYLAWTVSQREAHAETTLAIDELLADDEPARRALFAAVGAQRDQVSQATLAAAIDDPIDRALVDGDQHRFGTEDVEHVLGELSAGPMVRIVRRSRALAARKATIKIAPKKSTRDRGAAKRDVKSEPPASRGLSALLFGGLSFEDAERLGWLAPEDHAVSPPLRTLALPPYFALDPF